jgi:hypothetical protein
MALRVLWGVAISPLSSLLCRRLYLRFLGFSNYHCSMRLLCTGGPLERRLGFRICSCLRFRTALTVTLFSVAEEFTDAEYLSLLLTTTEDTYATFRVLLEREGLVDYLFDFWIKSDKKRMLTRFEKSNGIREEVYVIPRVDTAAETCKRRRLDERATNEHAMVLDSGGVAIDAMHNLPSSDDVDDAPQPGSLSRVDGKEDPHAKDHLLSTLVSVEVHERYQQVEAKLRRELAGILLDDNI